jgi:hypothetical protein
MPIRAHGNNAARAIPVVFQRLSGFMADVAVVATPVVTVTVANPVTPPASGSVPGLSAQVAFCGAPEQDIVSVPDDPFTGITWTA